jgi:hypothetical protein
MASDTKVETKGAPEPKSVSLTTAEIQRKLRVLDEKLSTCYGDQCNRIEAAKAELMKRLPDAVKAAMDSRTALMDERLRDIEAAVTASKVPAASIPSEITIPEDRVFVCPKCADALVIGQPECPNETCEQVIDWTLILTPDYLREVEKELEGAVKEIESTPGTKGQSH